MPIKNLSYDKCKVSLILRTRIYGDSRGVSVSAKCIFPNSWRIDARFYHYFLNCRLRQYASLILLVSSVPVYIARNYSGLAYNNRRMGKTCVYFASKVAEEDFFLSLSLWHGTVSTCSFARAVLNNPWEGGTRGEPSVGGRREREPRDAITVSRVGTNIRLQAVARRLPPRHRIVILNGDRRIPADSGPARADPFISRGKKRAVIAYATITWHEGPVYIAAGPLFINYGIYAVVRRSCHWSNTLGITGHYQN